MMVWTLPEIRSYIQKVEKTLSTGKEKKLKGLAFAKLYREVKELGTAQRYVNDYLSVNPRDFRAFSFLGQLLEDSQDFQGALKAYKKSLEINSNQKDVLLKVVELYSKVPVDPGRAKVWVDKASKACPGHPSVFNLKWHLLVSAPVTDYDEMEDVLTEELARRPRESSLHIKLVKLFEGMDNLEQACSHCQKVEKFKIFDKDADWLSCVVDTTEKHYQLKFRQGDQSSGFVSLTFYLAALCKLLELNLKLLTVRVAADIFGRLDAAVQTVHQVAAQLPQSTMGERETMCREVEAQLFFYGATLVTKMAVERRLLWNKAQEIACVLLMASYRIREPGSPGSMRGSSPSGGKPSTWLTMAYNRLSQTGHLLLELHKEKGIDWVKRSVANLSTHQGHTSVVSTIYSAGIPEQSHLQDSRSLLLAEVQIPDPEDLVTYDSAVIQGNTMDLQLICWLGLHWYSLKKNIRPGVGTLVSRLFRDISLDVKDLDNCQASTLCHRDIETFVYAVLRSCADRVLESRDEPFEEGEPRLLPFPLSQPFVTKQQNEWWSAAYGLYVGRVGTMSASKQRSVVQCGLEVIRCFKNHGIDPRILVYVANTFLRKADEFCTQRERDWDYQVHIESLQKRGLYYLKVALGLFEARSRSITLAEPQNPLIPPLSKSLLETESYKYAVDIKIRLGRAAVEGKDYNMALRYLNEVETPLAAYEEAWIYRNMASQYDADDIEGLRDHLFYLRKARERYEVCLRRYGNVKSDSRGIVAEELDEVRFAVQSGRGLAYSQEKRLDLLDALDETEECPDESVDVNVTIEEKEREIDQLSAENTTLQNRVTFLEATLNAVQAEVELLRMRRGRDDSASSSDNGKTRSLTDDGTQMAIVGLREESNASGRATPKLETEMSWDSFSPAPLIDKGYFAGLASKVEKIDEEDSIMKDRKGEDGDQDNDDENCIDGIRFEPVVHLTKKTHATGEEDEKVSFSNRAKLYRFDSEAYQWKERGIGELKILFDPRRSVSRILMRRDQVLRVCANHAITPDMKLEAKEGSKATWIWCTLADTSEGEPKPEKLAVRFKTVEIANDFKEKFVASQLSYRGNAATTTSGSERRQTNAPETSMPSNSPSNTWQCATCHFVNSLFTPYCQKCNSSARVPPAQAYEKFAQSSGTLTSSAATEARQGAGAVTASAGQSSNAKPTFSFSCTLGEELASPPKNSSNNDNSMPSKVSGTDTLEIRSKSLSEKSLSEKVGLDSSLAAPSKSPIVFPSASEQSLRHLPSASSTFYDFFGSQVTKSASHPWFPSGFGPTRDPGAMTTVSTDSLSARGFPVLGAGEVKSSSSNFPAVNSLLSSSLGHGNRLPLVEEQGRYNSVESSTGNVSYLNSVFSDTTSGRVNVADPRFNFFGLGSNASIFGDRTEPREVDEEEFFRQNWDVEDGDYYDDEEYYDEDGYYGSEVYDDSRKYETTEKEGYEEDEEEYDDFAEYDTRSRELFGGPITPKMDSDDEYGDGVLDRSNGRGAQAIDEVPTVVQMVDDDVFVTFARKTSKSQQAKAARFLLPPAFYAQESVAPCSGCYGCTGKVNYRGGPSIKVEQNTRLDTSAIRNVPESIGKPHTFGSKATPLSFADLASNLQSTFRTSDSNQHFQGAGTALFSSTGNEDDDGPRFEPLVHLEKLKVVKSGEEDESILFESRAKLYRFDEGTKQWKERGVGVLKILKNIQTARCRVLMRRDHILKLCANHSILPGMEPKQHGKSANAWLWATHADFSDGDPKPEKLLAKFKAESTANDFFSAFLAASSKEGLEEIKENVDNRASSDTRRPFEKESLTMPVAGFGKEGGVKFETARLTPDSRKAPTSELSMQVASNNWLKEKFAPPSGSWECETCLVPNGADKVVCGACDTPKAGVSRPPEKTPHSGPVFSFGGLAGQNQASSIRFGIAPQSEVRFGVAPQSEGSFGIAPQSEVRFGVAPQSEGSFGIAPQSEVSFGWKPQSGVPSFPPNKDVAGAFSFSTTPIKNGSVSERVKPANDGRVSVQNPFSAELTSMQSTVPVSIPLTDTKVNSKELVITSVAQPPSDNKSGSQVRGVQGFQQLFAPKPGSWECQVCLLRHDAGVNTCPACLTPRDGVESVTKEPPAGPVFKFGTSPIGSSLNPSLFKFGLPQSGEQSSNENKASSLSLQSSSAPTTLSGILQDGRQQTVEGMGASQTPGGKTKEDDVETFQQRFAPKPGSWECQGCLLRHNSDVKVCPACSTPRAGVGGASSPQQSTPSITFGTLSGAFPSDTSKAPVIRFGLPSHADGRIAGGTSLPSALGTKEKPALITVESAKDPSVLLKSNFTFDVATLAGTDSSSEQELPSFATGSSLGTAVGTPRNQGSQLPSVPVASSRIFSGVSNNVASSGKTSGTSFWTSPSPALGPFFTPPSQPLLAKPTDTPYFTPPSSTPSQALNQAESTTKTNFAFTPALGKSLFSLGSLAPQEPQIQTGDKMPNVDLSAKAVSVEPTSSSSGPGLLSLLGGMGTFSFAMGSPAAVATEGKPTSPVKQVPEKLKSPPRTPVDHHCSAESEEEDGEPQFSPLVHLEKVAVKTGEENERVVFIDRAKLFSYDDESKQWKERGVGDLKILQALNSAESRLVMRRDQVLKLCANHSLVEGMVIKPMGSSGKAYVWKTVGDVSDDDRREVTFAVKFRAQDTADCFRKAFEKAVEKVMMESISQVTPTIFRSRHQSMSEEVDPCYSTKILESTRVTSAERTIFAALEKDGRDTIANQSPVKLRYDQSSPLASNTSKLFEHVEALEPCKENVRKAERCFQPPGFFAPSIENSTSSNESETQGPVYGCNSPTANADDNPESEDHTIKFAASVALEKSRVSSGEEGEAVCFSSRAKMYGFDPDSKQWKERGVGELKVLHNEATKKYRLIMRRDQVKKLCANHLILKGMQLDALQSRKNTLMWFTLSDVAYGEAKSERLAVRFKSSDSMLEFRSCFERASKEDEVAGRGDTCVSVKETICPSQTEKEKVVTDTCLPESPSNTSRNHEKDRDDEVLITFIQIPASSDREKAERLLLPIGFYAAKGPWSYWSKTRQSSEGQERASPNANSPRYETRVEETAGESRVEQTVDNAPTKQMVSESRVKQPVGETARTFGALSSSTLTSFADLTGVKQCFASSSTVAKGFVGQGSPLFSALSSDDPEAYEATGNFTPAVNLNRVHVATGEEGQTVLFQERCKLYRFDTDAKQWKERGVGDLKILGNQESSQFRIVMRRDQIFRLCANHSITADIDVQLKRGSESTYVWNTLADISDGEPCASQFGARFKSKELADKFLSTFKNCQELLQHSRRSCYDASPIDNVIEESDNAAFAERVDGKGDSDSVKEDQSRDAGKDASGEVEDDKSEDASESRDLEKGDSGNESESRDLEKGDSGSVNESESRDLEKDSSEETKGEESACDTKEESGDGSGDPQKDETLDVKELKSGDAEKDDSADVGENRVVREGESRYAERDGSGDVKKGPTLDFKPLWGKDVEKYESEVVREDGIRDTEKDASLGLTGQGYGDPREDKRRDLAHEASGNDKEDEIGDVKVDVVVNFAGTRENLVQKDLVPPTWDRGVTEEGYGGMSFQGRIGGNEEFQGSPVTQEWESGVGEVNSGSVGEAATAKEREPPKFHFGTSSVSDISFASLSSFGGFNFTKTGSAAFAGAGKQLFSEVFASPSSDSAQETKAEEDEGPDVHFAPVVELQEVEVKSGEEDEDQIFATRVKMYRFNEDTQEWKERGTGIIKLLKWKGQEKYRLVARRDQIGKLCANHVVVPGMVIKDFPKASNTLMWKTTTDLSDSQPEPALLAAKFKTSRDMETFRNLFTGICDRQVLSETTQATGECTSSDDLSCQALREKFFQEYEEQS